MVEDQRELERTAAFFNNDEFVYELTPEQRAKAQKAFLNVESDDLNRGSLKRRVLDELIPGDFRESVRQAFMHRLSESSEKSSK